MIVHVHVPKTGGTTLRAALAQDHVVWRPRGPRGQGDAADGLISFLAAGCPIPDGVGAISGHIPLGVRDYLPHDVEYVTALRHPIDRALSHYFVEVGQSRWEAGEAPAFNDTIAAKRHVLSDLMTRYLCGDLDVFAGPATEKMLESAIANLEQVRYGFTEHLDDFISELGADPEARHRHAKWRPRGDEVDAWLVQEATDANLLDMQLWEAAGGAV